jgi:hypothetical protein
MTYEGVAGDERSEASLVIFVILTAATTVTSKVDPNVWVGATCALCVAMIHPQSSSMRFLQYSSHQSLSGLTGPTEASSGTDVMFHLLPLPEA